MNRNLLAVLERATVHYQPIVDLNIGAIAGFEALMRTIIAATSLIRARVVAEGVESAAQAFFLQAAGVDYGQGWFWSPALPAAELPKVLEAGFPNWRSALVERLNDARHSGASRNPEQHKSPGL